MDYVIENVKPTVVVITPTIGKEKLQRAVESVAKQTYENIKHLVVVDGHQFFDAVINMPLTIGKLQITASPINSGANGFYGHRIYAAYPHLVNEDYVAFLDEDNWWDEKHIASLINLIEKNRLDWGLFFTQSLY